LLYLSTTSVSLEPHFVHFHLKSEELQKPPDTAANCSSVSVTPSSLAAFNNSSWLLQALALAICSSVKPFNSSFFISNFLLRHVNVITTIVTNVPHVFKRNIKYLTTSRANVYNKFKLFFLGGIRIFMKFKKTLLLALPLLGVAVGGLVAFNSKSASVAEAADYSTPNRSLKVDVDGNVSATFTVSNEDFELNQGWLLCLFKNKPAYDTSTRKLVNSANLHPYSLEACEHYFFAASSEDSGEIIINWESTLADQKVAWKGTKAEGEVGHQLKDYFAEKDWHIVIGPRHFESQWGGSNPEKYPIGEGLNNIWENCDYYVGQKSALLNGADGQTYLDLTQHTGWEADEVKFAFYYWNGANNGWSDFATSVSNKDQFKHLYSAEYSLEFVPTNTIAVRFDKDVSVPSWESTHYNQTQNLDFHKYSVVVINGDDSGHEYPMANVKFSDTEKVALDHLKRNDSGKSENFNQWFPLTVGQIFDVEFEGATYSEFKIHSSLASNFDVKSVENKVKVLVDGIYALYFNTDEHSLYITTSALAEADEWSIAFLGDGCTSTKSSWDTFEEDYDDLSDEAKEILDSEEHVAHDAEVTGYIALAMQRYDFLVSNFAGFDDYIGRCDSQHFSPYQSGALVISNGENNALLIIIAVTAVSLIAFTTLLVFKKRKSIR